MASIFSKIVNGEIPCYKIAEDENFLAFLDLMPVEIGHTLVIPKKDVDYIFDLDDQTYIDLHLFSKRVANAIEAVVPCLRIGIAVIGLEVPHTHIHLIPLHSIGSLNFTKERVSLTNEEFLELAKKIKSKFL